MRELPENRAPFFFFFHERSPVFLIVSFKVFRYDFPIVFLGQTLQETEEDTGRKRENKEQRKTAAGAYYIRRSNQQSPMLPWEPYKYHKSAQGAGTRLKCSRESRTPQEPSKEAAYYFSKKDMSANSEVINNGVTLEAS